MKKVIGIIFLLLGIAHLILAQSDNNKSSEDHIKGIIEEKIRSGEYDPVEGIWETRQTLKAYHGDQLLNSLDGERFTQCIIKEGFEYQVYTIESVNTGLTLQLVDKANFRVIQERENGDLLYGTGVAVNSSNLILNIKMGEKTGTVAMMEIKLRKIYPTSQEIQNIKEKAITEFPLTGTGFAISSTGLVVTNNHVIENARSIKIRGVNGDFSKAFNATKVKEDPLNDLAIIRITDPEFKNLGVIPYKVRMTTSEVGEDIFVLGYPLTATMGEEVKLTTGVISSKTGFQGNVTQYQISAPIQPGNSGGPLFDKQGNIIGIVNSKHLYTDNVGYAVKVSSLKNLLDLIPEGITFPNTSSISNKSLPEQVRLLRDFVFIIEVNND